MFGSSYIERASRVAPAVVLLFALYTARVAEGQTDEAGVSDAGDSSSRPSGLLLSGLDAGLMVADGGTRAETLVVVPVAPSTPEVIDVTVRSQRDEARQLQTSAEAVNVVDTKRARQQTVDLGEVLARTQGVGVRREGGLGSRSTISLNGLQGDQVRLFMDGIPLQLAGYPFGLVNIPVNLVERIEVFRGVVPVRFGTDALGGAINVVTDRSYETHLGASYMVGSFGIHRTTVNGRYLHEPSHLVVGAAAFVDVAKNDFIMSDRELMTPGGGSDVRSIKRWHDGYRSYGANVEAGIVDKKWARRLVVSGFLSSYDKDLQHNAIMSNPYGEVTSGETIVGITAHYEVDLTPALGLEVIANYAHRDIDFQDLSLFKYLWSGAQGRAVGRADARGEILGKAIDQTTVEDSVFGRVNLSWSWSDAQRLRASLTPQFTTRNEVDHVEGRDDPRLDDAVAQLIGGLEHELDAFDDKLSNIAFAKVYYTHTSHESEVEEPTRTFRVETKHDRKRGGVGDSLRYRFTPWLLAKASYEYATRLPNSDELFGNGVLIGANAELKPERSHNVNVGPRLELKRTALGSFLLDLNAFLRNSKDQIILLAGKQRIPYANISDVRGRGIENAVSWSSPGRWATVDASGTWLDARNEATKGTFALFKGMRIPSRPWLFASWGARARVADLPGPDDAIEPFYYGRYVHSFERGWAIGDPDYKLSVPRQVNHDLGVTYSRFGKYGSFTTTFEVDNLSDAKLYDVLGVQRPGRSYNFKLTARL